MREKNQRRNFYSFSILRTKSTLLVLQIQFSSQIYDVSTSEFSPQSFKTTNTDHYIVYELEENFLVTKTDSEEQFH